MPNTGGGTLTPVAAGVAGGASVAQPIPYTLLSLPRYARIMGLNPMHFHRGMAPAIRPMPMPDYGCDDIWYKYDWQDTDKVSWWQLANTILTVEQELATLVGYWAAPTWIEEDEYKYPGTYYPEYSSGGINVAGYLKGINLKYGKIISAGHRAVTLVGTATTVGGSLAYTDEDGDGLVETATILMATALTDPAEIKVYHVNQDGDQDWEIRSPRSKTIAGGFVTIVYDAWQLIDPDLYEDFPTTDGIGPIDISTTGNYVTSVDVYREYTDTTQASAQFYWESDCTICGGTGCTVCTPATQTGCASVRDAEQGVIIPAPAVYSSGSWTPDPWTGDVEPKRLKVWYYSGARDQRFIKGVSRDPLSTFWAEIIAWVTTARLERPLCSCAYVSETVSKLQFNLAMTPSDMRTFLTNDALTSPLGTRVGEVLAWKRIKYAVKDKVAGFALA